jgi:hypothetical protein
MNLRKVIGTWACLLLGPFVFGAGIIASLEDLEFSKKSVPVDGHITAAHQVYQRKGPDQVRFEVDFTPPEGKVPLHGTFTVNESKAEALTHQDPVPLRVLATKPDRLRLEGESPQGWIPIPIGLVMFGLGIFAIRRRD